MVFLWGGRGVGRFRPPGKVAGVAPGVCVWRGLYLENPRKYRGRISGEPPSICQAWRKLQATP